MNASAPVGIRDRLAGLVVVGIGNELRRDDGIGVCVARALAGSLGALGARVVSLHQLVPELAVDLADARAVIFVDAAVDLGPGAVRVVAPGKGVGFGQPTHRAEPEALLELCAALYRKRPAAMVVSIGAADLGAGCGLSAAARRGCDRAGEVIRALAEVMVADA